ncbi:MAG: PQQ-dependent sugar dehydrogenase [Acidimicrobiia bacterium]
MQLSLALALLLTAVTLPPGGTFVDDDGAILEPGIEAMAAESITVGCNPPFNDRFCPDRELSRAEMATMLSRALSLPATAADYFVDDTGHVLEGAINRIAEQGITVGCNPPANDRFCPDRSLTRAEAAALLARAFTLPPSSVNHFIDDEGHILEGAINRIADAGITAGCNPPSNDRFCPERALTRAEMATMLARAMGLTAITPPPRPPLDWDLVVSGLNQPVQALTAPGEDRLFIVEQTGAIRTFANGTLNPNPFLTVPVVYGGERGLFSMAFHPDYPTDRRMFVWYYGASDRTYLVEYDIAADLHSASSPSTVLSVSQPATNHNGGFLAFGDDGYLYLGLGDGGGGNDTFGNARDLTTLLGKMVRIDVDGSAPYEIPNDNPYVGPDGARDEIWASGLRNPWRWSFDEGRIYIGDVGQSTREEINVVPAVPAGYDFGWSRYEGTVCNPNDADPSCSTAGLTMPVAEYGRSSGKTVTGGVVYRGTTVRSLQAYYLYADLYSGLLRGFRWHDGKPVEPIDLTGSIGMSGIVSFGVDGDGELLVVSLFDNAIYRLTGG